MSDDEQRHSGDVEPDSEHEREAADQADAGSRADDHGDPTDRATPAGDDAPHAEDAATDELREQLVQMREEADRIASLGTGDEQVESAERFAEDAGRMDEQIGASARDADEDQGG